MMRTEAKIPFYLIWRFIIRSSKWTLGLTIFLMGVAFINLIFVTSLFNGIIEGSNDQIINTYVGHVTIDLLEGHDVIGNIGTQLSTILKTPGVVGASAQTVVPASMKYKSITLSRQILAIDPDKERTVTNIATKMVEGLYLSASDTDGIMIGKQIAGGTDTEQNATSFKGAHAGDTITMTLANGVSKTFTIRGIFDTKFINADVRTFMTRAALEELNPAVDDSATGIIIRIDKKGNEQKVIDALKANGVIGTFGTWEDDTGLMKSITKSFLSINVLMSVVGVMIAAITIFIVVYIDIINRKRQIGILRAIGIKAWIIRVTYVLQSAVYSFFGVIVGTGIFFGAIVPYFIAHPFSLPICDATLIINPADFVIRAETIMLVAILSGLIPAIFVTRMKILHAILGK